MDTSLGLQIRNKPTEFKFPKAGGCKAVEEDMEGLVTTLYEKGCIDEATRDDLYVDLIDSMRLLKSAYSPKVVPQGVLQHWWNSRLESVEEATDNRVSVFSEVSSLPQPA